MNTTTALRKLNKIMKDVDRTELVRAVAESIIDQLDGYETPEKFFNDLSKHGCSSGMISELIYYTDTYNFFDEHYDDIMQLIVEQNKMCGEPLDLMKDHDIKNTGAWLAYEETARQIASELGIEE